MTGSQIIELANAAVRAGAKNVIVSRAGDVNELKKDVMAGSDLFDIASIEGVMPIGPRGQKARLIVNSSAGKMHIVNAISDASLVAGVVNLFEPLYQGNPVVFFDSNSSYMTSILNGSIRRFDSGTFQRMGFIAKASGGSVEVSSLEQATLSLANYLNSPRPDITPPNLIRDEHGLTSVDYLMRNLHDHILRQTTKHQSFILLKTDEPIFFLDQHGNRQEVSDGFHNYALKAFTQSEYVIIGPTKVLDDGKEISKVGYLKHTFLYEKYRGLDLWIEKKFLVLEKDKY